MKELFKLVALVLKKEDQVKASMIFCTVDLVQPNYPIPS